MARKTICGQRQEAKMTILPIDFQMPISCFFEDSSKVLSCELPQVIVIFAHFNIGDVGLF